MNIKPDKEIEKGDNIVNIGGRNTHRVWKLEQITSSVGVQILNISQADFNPIDLKNYPSFINI
jgi:hypothetical protein